MRARAMSGRYRWAQRWLRRFFHAYWPVRVEGLENLPTGPAIFVCNHPSVLDGLLLSLYLPRRIYFLVRSDVMRLPLLGHFLAWLGAITVEKGGNSLDQARAALAQGRDLVLFPEADPTASRELAPFHRGAAVLAIDTGLPLAPLGLIGPESLIDSYARWGGVTLRIGPPLLGNEQESAENLRDRSVAAVTALLHGSPAPPPCLPWPGLVLIPLSWAGLQLSDTLRRLQRPKKKRPQHGGPPGA